MRAKIKANRIYLEGTGLELLRLKAAFHRSLGPQVKSAGRLAFSIPTSSIWLVRTALPAEIVADPQIQHLLAIYEMHAVARSKALKITDADDGAGIPEKWMSVLDPKQRSAVSALAVPGILGMCLFDEQGIGKTVMALAAFDILRETAEVDKMIVVCPKSMVSQWPQEVERFLGADCIVASFSSGDSAKQPTPVLPKTDVVVVNYEGVAKLSAKLNAVTEKHPYLLIIDESYYVKNPKALRAEAIQELRRMCKKCFVLCGTPAPNSAYDIVNQFDLADLGFTFAGFTSSKDIANDRPRIEELIDQRGLYVRRLKVDAIPDLAAKNFHVEQAVLTGKQRSLYLDARDKLVLQLRGLDNVTFKKQLQGYLQRRMTLLQICACPQVVDPTCPPSAKFGQLDDLIDRLIKEHRKVVVWSFFTASIREIVERYARYSPVFIDGTVSDAGRRQAISQFQTEKDTMLFIGNPAAAGAGITLHASADMIYFSFSNQAAHYLQSQDRIHRRGQTASAVNYYMFVCSGTVEETEVKRLRRKEVDQHSLLGDVIEFPSSLDEALNELVGNGP
jgi:SNF2 family DNA or RNA helicase